MSDLDRRLTELAEFDGYPEDMVGVQATARAARTEIAGLRAQLASARKAAIEECAKRADNQARIPDNTAERRAHIYCATEIAKAIRALSDEKRCICQNQHRRGYCTHPTCPYGQEKP